MSSSTPRMFSTCDGVRRRDFLKMGAVGGGALTLANFLRLQAAGAVRPSRAQAAIFISLQGGPSHVDTFDMKPEAPAEYRGSFSPIATQVPGLSICEHLPRLAGCADRYAVVRGVTHTLAAHHLGSQYVNTGNRPIASLEYPGYGAVVTRETWQPSDIPPFVAIPNSTYQRPGFLGVQYAPLNTEATPRAGRPFQVRGIGLTGGVTVPAVQRRHQLLGELDQTFQELADQEPLIRGLDKFSQQAHDMITSRRARRAFDVGQESPAFARKFGESPFGTSCLLAARLVESGVRFVSISNGGWDTHQENFTRLKDRLLPPLDEGLSALLLGLDEKGLLDSTIVFVTGEFGRTPKINNRSTDGGRDHYPRCMFMLLAGGGIRGGQVVGASNDLATEPRDHGFSPDDIAATFYHSLGIDPSKEFHTDIGRPITLVRDGKIIRELLAS
jgi:hypothetical protein